MTIVKVNPGACGFHARIVAEREDSRRVRIRVESDCEHVRDLSFVLDETGPLRMRDVLGVGCDKNPVLKTSGETLPHAACPLPAAIVKAAEVELGLNVPVAATIEFEQVP